MRIEVGAVRLDQVFQAVAHPARRKILQLLAEGEQPVDALAQRFRISRSAISQHLRLLVDAHLASDRKVGRERRYSLRVAGLNRMDSWLASLGTSPQRKEEGKASSLPDRQIPRSNYTDVIVGRARLNKNHLDLGRELLVLPDEDGRSDLDRGNGRSVLQKRRHLDPEFHEAALEGLRKGREGRMWTDAAMIEAIRDFTRREGRPPRQREFRADFGLPGYGTVWRRLGTIGEVVRIALRS
jgi:DNA-binding transcriptional ArsR family regulator